MTIDNITIIISAILIVLAIATSLLSNPFFRLGAKDDDTPLDDDDCTDAQDKPDGQASEETSAASAFKGPRLSVVVLSNGSAEQMDSHLSAILTQDYAPRFEVIVVAVQRDSQTEDVLKRYGNNAKLYTTFVPQRSLFMSRSKLAATIGVKAAHNEWVVLTDSRYTPLSDEWLKAMSTGCATGTDLVLGYSCYADNAKPFYRFERLREQAYAMRRADKGTAIFAKGGNIMFRKDLFINNDGYRGNLQFVQGEYDFIINKYAQEGNTAVVTRPEAWMQEDAPFTNAWRIDQIGFVNYRGHLRGATSYRWLHAIDTLALYVNYAACIGCGIWGAVAQNWVLTGAAALALIITLATRTIIATKVFHRFDTRLSAWRAVPYELRAFWHTWLIRIRYTFADKHVFTSHKL